MQRLILDDMISKSECLQIRNSQRKEDNTMPELSRFERMVIKMLFNDTVQHNKPHVHVTYGEYKTSVGIVENCLRTLFHRNNLECW